MKPPKELLNGDVVFSEATLKDGQIVRAVMLCQNGLAATQILPKAGPYVSNAKSAVMPNKNGENTDQILFAIPAFLSGYEVGWMPTDGGSTTHIKQNLGPDGKIINKISHKANTFKRGGAKGTGEMEMF